jgi:hypothetical protein
VRCREGALCGALAVKVAAVMMTVVFYQERHPHRLLRRDRQRGLGCWHGTQGKNWPHMVPECLPGKLTRDAGGLGFKCLICKRDLVLLESEFDVLYRVCVHACGSRVQPLFRDQRLLGMEMLANHRVREAIAAGEMDGLAGSGKPREPDQNCHAISSGELTAGQSIRPLRCKPRNSEPKVMLSCVNGTACYRA